MFVRSLCSLALLGTLTLTGTAVGQGTAASDAAPVDLDVRLRALETMNGAASSKLADALAHEKSLRGYVQQQGLAAACGEASSNTQHDMALGFDKALAIAIQHEQVAPSGSNTNATPGEIKAYTDLASSTWDKLQSSMANVEHLSDCLHKQKKFNDYLGWSGDQQKSQAEAMKARNAEVSKKNTEQLKETEKKEDDEYAAFKIAQQKQHQAFLNQSWTKYKFDQTNDLKAYKYRTQYGPNSYYNSYAGNMYGGGGGGGYYGGGW